MLGIGRWAATTLLWVVVGLARRKTLVQVTSTMPRSHNRDTEEFELGANCLRDAISSCDRRLKLLSLRRRGSWSPGQLSEANVLLDERLAYTEALAHADVH